MNDDLERHATCTASFQLPPSNAAPKPSAMIVHVCLRRRFGMQAMPATPHWQRNCAAVSCVCASRDRAKGGAL